MVMQPIIGPIMKVNLNHFPLSPNPRETFYPSSLMMNVPINAATWSRVGMHYEDQNRIAVLWMTREPSLHDS